MSDVSSVRTTLIDFHNLNIEEAAQHVKRLSSKTTFSYVVTPNIDHLVRICNESSGQLQAIYADSALTVCDSRIIETLLSVAGKPIKAVVPGSDLTQFLFSHILTSQSRIIVFGCDDDGIVSLKDQFPQLNIKHINPSMGFIRNTEEVNAHIQNIVEYNADYIFLAVGSPQQEIFVNQLKQSSLASGVALCIGASINFMIGVESRAPKWLQRIRMEWLYRLLQSPARLVKRYSLNALYLWAIFRRFKEPIDSNKNLPNS